MSEEPKVEPATPELAAKDTFRILIMDNPEHVEQLKTACKNAGHSVVSANTIEEAFRFLEGKNHADVIVCAAHLEDESLFDFLKRLRSNPIHKQSMFMTLSLAPGPIGVQLNDSTEKAARLLGADAFVSMPVFDAPQLIAEIKNLLPLVPMLERSRIETEEKAQSDNQ
jgi:CheY-like chemotaxis protein